MNGLIIKDLAGSFFVTADGNSYECKARGKFRNDGISPLVGDKVEFSLDSNKIGVVEKIFQRKNSLIRPRVANIDKLFIVSSYQKPAPNTYLIDKITAIAEYNNIEPVIVFNKCDMGDFTHFIKIYKNAGLKTLCVSALTGEGIDGLVGELKDCISAFTGNSGVGKSSILNSIFGNNNIATGEVSDKLGRGRHTTRHTELIKLHFGGYAADTPGFSAIDYDSTDYGFKEKLLNSFRDLSSFDTGCKFTSCTHITEPDCRIREALKNGQIEQSRYDSYIQLFGELKDLKPWNTGKNKK